MLLQQQGLGLFDEAGDITITSPKAVEALTLLQTLNEKGLLKNVKGWDGRVTSAKDGDSAVTPEAVWWIGTLLGDAPELSGTYGVTELPAFEAGGVRTSNSGGSGLAVPTQAKNPQLAAAFVGYALADADHQASMMEHEGLFPSYLPALQDEYFQEPQHYFWASPCTAVRRADPEHPGDHVHDRQCRGERPRRQRGRGIRAQRRRPGDGAAGRGRADRDRDRTRDRRIGMAVTAIATREATRPTRRRALGRRLQRPGAWFVLPAALLLVVFFTYPLISSLWQSFFATSGGVSTWVGLEQYARLFKDPLVVKSLVNAGIILVLQVPLMIALAVGLAYLLNQSWLRFRSGFRLLTFLPAVTTLVAYAVVFRVMLATDGGAVNQLLAFVGHGAHRLAEQRVVGAVALIAAITWRWTGYNMVIILAGLQSIPAELYEAARIDGAGRWQIFTKVVIPQLRPALIFTTVTSTIGALQLFDENWILTEGGPNDATLTPVLYLYKVGFRQFDFGYASAIAWLLVAITAIIAFVQFRLMREKP